MSFSQYNSVEEAAASRQALHGIKWPTTSPKILAVDFADNDEVSTCSRITLVFFLGRICLTIFRNKNKWDNVYKSLVQAFIES